MKTHILDREYRSQLSQPQSESGGESDLVSPALDLVSDHFRIHRARFSESLRGPGEVSRARQVAIYLVFAEGGLRPWQLATAFALDLSTVKNALKRVRIRRECEEGFEGVVSDLARAYRASLSTKARGA